MRAGAVDEEAPLAFLFLSRTVDDVTSCALDFLSCVVKDALSCGLPLDFLAFEGGRIPFRWKFSKIKACASRRKERGLASLWSPSKWVREQFPPYSNAKVSECRG